MQVIKAEELTNELACRLAALKVQKQGFSSDHEVGYHEGQIAALESVLDLLASDGE